MARYDPHANAGGAPSSWSYGGTPIADMSKGGGFSLGGLIGEVVEAPFELTANLAKDIGQATYGFFPGLYKLATDPIDTAKLIGKSYQHNYGDLFGAYNKLTQGDLGGAAGELKDFGDKVYDHPLGYILDVATVATVGAGAAVKVPSLLGKVGVTNPTLQRLAAAGERQQLTRIDRPGAKGRLEKLVEKEGTKKGLPRLDQYFWTSGNPVTRKRQEFAHGLAEKWATTEGFGGRYRQLPAQMAYERTYLNTLATNMAAMEYMWGDMNRLQTAMEKAGMNPQQRAQMNRSALEYNYDNARAKSRMVPAVDWANGKVNTRTYELLAEKKYVMGPQKSGGALYTANPEKFMDNIENLGQFLGTTQLKRADVEMIDGVPHVRILNKSSAKNLGIDAANTKNMLSKSYYNTTSWWKSIVLGLAPRFMLNNTIGGSVMHAADNMGSHAMFGTVEAWKHIFGKEKAANKLEEAVKGNGYMTGKDDWMMRDYGDQLGQGFYYTSSDANLARTRSGELTPGEKLRGEADVKPRLIHKVTGPTFRGTAKIERYLRASAIVSNVRSHPIVQAEMKRLQKYPKWRDPRNRKELFDHVADWAGKNHPEVARQVAQDVEQTMGNYVLLTGLERKVRAVDPFYLWQRHIVKHGFHLAMDRPGRTDLGQHIGQVGAAWAQEELGGEIPDFMQALVPGGVTDPVSGRIGAVGTQGMNPYGTVGELTTTAGALMPFTDEVEGVKTPGEGLGPLMNPFLAAGVEELTGTSLLTGQPKYTEEGGLQGFFNNLGPIGSVIGSPITHLPQVTAAENIISPQEYKEPTLYAKTPAEYISALLGIPIKWVDPQAARKLARQQAARRGDEK